jgi:hypothetical protein
MSVLNNSKDVVVSDTLVAKLAEVFPDKLPRHNKDYGGYTIEHLIGQQSVIDYILSLKDREIT